MKIGATIPQTEIGPDPSDVVAFAQAAEAAGLDFLNVYDHVLGADRATRPDWSGPYDADTQFHEVFTLFAYLAAFVELELVTGILILPQRQTVLVAKQAAQIDLLTGGRFRLGIGTGWNAVEYHALGENFRDRGIRSEEQIDLLRRLWTEDVVTFDGRFEHVDRAGILPRPVQRPIPVWIGGYAPKVLERVGRIGDGWIANVGPGDALRDARAAIDRAAESAGRDPATIGLQLGVQLASDWTATWLRAQLEERRVGGATHVSIGTMNVGRSPQEHIDAIAAVADALG
jgi:probable F420-dependent oxidoreductase